MAVCRVETSRRGVVYMSVAHPSTRKAVVEVEAERFLALWRQPLSSHPDVAHQSVARWPSDYKFRDAEQGFSRGEWNPVPLARVSCGSRCEPLESRISSRDGERGQQTANGAESSQWLSFSNGITRTIWLFVAGAATFPVECGVDEAPLLQQLAGLPGRNFTVTADLLPEPTLEQHFEELRADEERQRKLYATRRTDAV